MDWSIGRFGAVKIFNIKPQNFNGVLAALIGRSPVWLVKRFNGSDSEPEE